MIAFFAENTWIVWWAVIMLAVLRWFHLMASRHDKEQEEPEYLSAHPPLDELNSAGGLVG